MKNYETVIGEACRVEYNEQENKLYLVFEIKDEQHKQYIKKNWVKDIEFRLVEKLLVKDDERDSH